jgi:hypothetical protein
VVFSLTDRFLEDEVSESPQPVSEELLELGTRWIAYNVTIWLVMETDEPG